MARRKGAASAAQTKTGTTGRTVEEGLVEEPRSRFPPQVSTLSKQMAAKKKSRTVVEERSPSPPLVSTLSKQMAAKKKSRTVVEEQSPSPPQVSTHSKQRASGCSRLTTVSNKRSPEEDLGLTRKRLKKMASLSERRGLAHLVKDKDVPLFRISQEDDTEAEWSHADLIKINNTEIMKEGVEEFAALSHEQKMELLCEVKKAKQREYNEAHQQKKKTGTMTLKQQVRYWQNKSEDVDMQLEVERGEKPRSAQVNRLRMAVIRQQRHIKELECEEGDVDISAAHASARKMVRTQAKEISAYQTSFQRIGRHMKGIHDELEYICDLYEVPMLEAPEIDIEEDLE